MVKLKYIGSHRPQVEMEFEPVKAQELLNTGEYILIEDDTGTIEEVKITKSKKSSTTTKND